MNTRFAQSFVAAFLVTGALALGSCTDTTTVGSASASGTFGPGIGGGPSGPLIGTAGTKVQVLASSPQIPSSGANTVNLTAVALDANGQAKPGILVILSTGTDPSAYVSGISNGGLTDANGQVTGTLNLGATQTNRTILISATTPDGAVGNASVAVVGTAITVSGNSSLAFGANTTLIFSVKDSAGTALPGITVTLSSANGNSIAPATGVTDSSGQTTAVVTATTTGNDVITASAAGTTKTQTLTISTAGFAFTAPAGGITIPLNTPTSVSIHWTSAGNPVIGQPVTFFSSRGAFVGSPSTTNALGDTTGVTISSPSAGPATLTAIGSGVAATLNVTFVATTASNISVQAVPGTIQITTGAVGQTSNVSTISVVVRDAANNVVQNAGVNFFFPAPGDTTGGRLNTSTAITDASGNAAVTYTASGNSSAQNGVVISAQVTDVGGVPVGAPVTGTTSLTVSGQSLLVRLGTDNLVASIPPLNQKTWVAIVTDAAGNAVSGATVTFSLRPGRFRKGHYVPGVSTWVRVTNATCLNEDINFNGILDAGEDTNGNGALDPPGVSTVNPTAVTDATGIAKAIITYPKDHATWAEVELLARSGVSSNDPPTTAFFFLDGLASDYANLQVSPPGEISPYGDSASCADTL